MGEERIQAVSFSTISNEEIRRAQLQDVDIKHILNWKEKDEDRPKWQEVSHLSSATKTYWINWLLLEVRDGVLMRRWESDDGKEVSWKVTLPRTLRSNVLDELHCSITAGHLGVNKMLHKVQRRYYWVGLAADVRLWVKRCTTCARLKNPPKKNKAPLQRYRVGAPIERVAMDILGPLPETDNGNKYVLVVGDYFTKWIESYPLPDQEAETVARVLVQEFICRYGIPRELHSDQGRNFESNVMAEICRMLGIKKTRTCPLHPQGDGFIERFNRTLLSMVTSLLDPDEEQKDWDEKIPFAMLAYRSAVQESTGESPAMMMLGREITLPVDLILPSPELEIQEQEYVSDIRENIQQAHENAREKLGVAAERQARCYDRNTTKQSFIVGDWAWLYDASRKRGVCPKLTMKWKGPFMVVAKLSDVVYRIQQSAKGKPKVVHIDRLKAYSGPQLRNWLDNPIRQNPERYRVPPARYRDMQ